MTTQKFEIEISVVNSLLLTTLINNIKHYLNGIHFECKGKSIIAVSTDGHRMSVARIGYEGEPFDSFTLPRDALASLKAKSKIEIVIENVVVIVNDDISSRRVPHVDGTYPDWRRVIPDSFTGEAGHFNPLYLADLVKVRKFFGLKNKTTINLLQNGDRAAIDKITDDFFVLIMPIGAPANWERPSIPGWCKQ